LIGEQTTQWLIAVRQAIRQADLARSKNRIHPQALARTVGDLAKRDAVFVLDTGLNTLWSANWIRQSGCSGLSALSTTPPSDLRWVKPTASRRSIAHVR
jgi:thiamine pyrophosphate-dependent acetolactate synthase large subunit-like protein